MRLHRDAWIVVWMLGLSCWCCWTVTQAEEPGADGAGEEVTRPLAKAITMLGVREDDTRYVVPPPRLLMKVYDSDRGGEGGRVQQGAIWAWGAGRPIAITEFWRWQGAENWGHTFISTTPGRVVANLDEHTWQPAQPGLRFQPFDNAPAPSETKDERAEQLVQLASRFSGYEITRPRQVVDLSAMATPIDRYQTDGVDGAIFALAHEENPEALLFLEAVVDPLAPACWRYALAKCTSSTVFVELDGKQIAVLPGELNHLGSDKEPFWVLFRSGPASVP